MSSTLDTLRRAPSRGARAPTPGGAPSRGRGRRLGDDPSSGEEPSPEQIEEMLRSRAELASVPVDRHRRQPRRRAPAARGAAPHARPRPRGSAAPPPRLDEAAAGDRRARRPGRRPGRPARRPTTRRSRDAAQPAPARPTSRSRAAGPPPTPTDELAHRGLRAHRRHPDRGARRPTTARSTGCASPGSTPARASPRCSATSSNGRWLIAPARRAAAATRRVPRRHARARDRVRHRRGRGARHRLHADPRAARVDVVRVVEGVCGAVPMHMDLIDPLRLRLDRPVGARRRRRRDLDAVAGPDAVLLCARRSSCTGPRCATIADFAVARRRQGAVRARLVPVVTSGRRRAIDADRAVERDRRAWWRSGRAGRTYDGRVGRRGACARSSR